MNPTDMRWQMAAEDLHALAWLHASERSPAELLALVAHGFPSSLSLVAPSQPEVIDLEEALRQLDSEEATSTPHRCADDLAADYAAIYLNNSLRASPYESVWRDDDQLMMQEPTFLVRAFYARNGMAVPNWRHMPDDHIAHELEFIAQLLERGQPQQAARFLQDHLMQWLPGFAAAVAQRARTRLYAALGTLTLTSCQALQDRLPKVVSLPPLVASPAIVAATAPPAGCGQG
jgi:TorA maturation chaperone TorD